MSVSPRRRIKTGIEALDFALSGGIPEGSLILVEGHPGVGKTVLASQFIYYGATELGEVGVYVSLNERYEDFIQNMNSLGMDFKKLEDKGLFKYVDLLITQPSLVKHALNTVNYTIEQIGAKRVVIDSITPIIRYLGQEEFIKYVSTVLGRLTKAGGITVFLVKDLRLDLRTEVIGEEFLCDGYIRLTFERVSNTLARKMEIVKMRGTNVLRNSLWYVIDRGFGGIHSCLPMPMISQWTKVKEVLSTGINQLDEALNGGIPTGSINLFRSLTYSIIPKLLVKLMIKWSKEGRRILFQSCTSSRFQVLRDLKSQCPECLKGDCGKIVILPCLMEFRNPFEVQVKTLYIATSGNYDIIISDGLLRWFSTVNPVITNEILMTIQSAAKNRNKTFIFTTYGHLREDLGPTIMVDIADNIIQLDKEEDRVRISFIKNWNIDHTKDLVISFSELQL
jgi:circadian clock protein KaiC